MLNDGVTAQFTHTLLVTDRLEGSYKCMIANEFSEFEAELIVQGETDLNY